MRWRTEAEVVEGKGQFICGEKSCPANSDLRTWEVNFKYEEQGTTKNALVKQRLCPKCSDMLNFRQKRKEVKTKHKQKTKRQKVKRDNEERAIKKRKHERNRSQSRLSSSSSPSSSPHSKAGRSKSHQKKRRSYSEADTGERFLDQFWEDMMS